MKIKQIILGCLSSVALWATGPMLGDEKPYPYESVVQSNDTFRTALMGTGKEVNTYIADRISLADKGDTIRLDYYLVSNLRSSSEQPNNTPYFFNAIKTALENGARVEIISESKWHPQLVSGKTYKDENIKALEKAAKHKNAYKFYEVDHGGDSTDENAINHRKVALLDIDGKREIVISTANIYAPGDERWQAAIVLDGNHYDSQWRWWNDVLNTDICFAKMGSQKECRLGNGGYESNYEGWTASYIIDKTKYETMVEWLKNMKYSEGCSLRMLMGHLGSTKVLNEMKRIAEDGCKVDLIYAKEYIDGSPYKYKKGNFEVEHQEKVHAKMILWQGKYENKGIVQYAWVGSFNATDKAAHENDETMVRIQGEKLFKAFWNYFQVVEYDD